MASQIDGMHFTPIDYAIFIVLLVVSNLIGFYYGFISKKKQNSTTEYLLGDRQMMVVPIAISLIVTHISGLTLLGIPAEIYAYGTQYWISCFSVVGLVSALKYVFYPVFHDMQLLSTFTYLERRFNRKLRLAASGASAILSLSYMPLWLYIPALALNQVSGANVYIVSAVLCLTCLFYTTVGGLRAVVWTDAIQFILMFGSLLIVIVMGILNLRYPLEMFAVADEGQRLILFNLDPNPLLRSSVWIVTIGITPYWCASLGAAQSCIQKLISIGDRKSAEKAINLYGLGFLAFNVSAILLGIVLYANMHDCDPYTTGLITKLDQIVPYFVMRIGARIPGLPGMFIAGVFSGGLSSMSGKLNSICCIIYEDFLKHRLKNTSDQMTSRILKIIVLVAGLIVLALVFVVERLSSVFELTLSIYGIVGGAILGLFTSGMLSRRMNAKGAVCGAIVSVLLVGTIAIGAQSLSRPHTLPMRTDGCERIVPNWNETINRLSDRPIVADDGNDELFWLFRISYKYYTLIGCATVWIIGYPISLCTKSNKVIDDILLAPFLRRKNKKIENIEIIGEKLMTKIIKTNK